MDRRVDGDANPINKSRFFKQLSENRVAVNDVDLSPSTIEALKFRSMRHKTSSPNGLYRNKIVFFSWKFVGRVCARTDDTVLALRAENSTPSRPFENYQTTLENGPTEFGSSIANLLLRCRYAKGSNCPSGHRHE
jgi:hypothetical protein